MVTGGEVTNSSGTGYTSMRTWKVVTLGIVQYIVPDMEPYNFNFGTINSIL
ncbi:MAG: hypothetical protein CM15mP65_22310 [Crocinitomicaceae bacterium]|nr:MAG: hypothetical protein CM15mP65_22310 [Crocinitomicaceae bacterium]